MLTTFSDIRNDFIRKAGIQTTAAGYTDAIIGGWAQQAARFATSYKKWPHTEGRISTTFASGAEEFLFEGYKADTFRMLIIGGKRLQKLNFEDYMIMKEENPTATDRVYSDFGRLVYVNPLVDASGTLTAYGQYTPVDIDTTDESSTTVFSNVDEEANGAIVDEMLSYKMSREQKDKEAQFYHERAVATLDSLWSRLEAEQYAYQTHRTRGGWFKRMNILGGAVQDELIRRDQFPFG